MDTTQTKDSKLVTIWILAIALIVVFVLYIMELRKPDTLREFVSTLSENRQDIKESCADLKTEAGRDKCVKALNETKDTLQDLK